MTSRTTVLAVVIGLALFALGCLVSATILTATDHKVPGQVWTLGATAIGALASMLASTRSTLGPKDTEPTTIQGLIPVAQPKTAGSPQGTAP